MPNHYNQGIFEKVKRERYQLAHLVNMGGGYHINAKESPIWKKKWTRNITKNINFLYKRHSIFENFDFVFINIFP